MEPVYVTRGEKLRNGLLTIIVGIVLLRPVPLLGQFLIAIGAAMIISGVIRGEERIA